MPKECSTNWLKNEIKKKDKDKKNFKKEIKKRKLDIIKKFNLNNLIKRN